MALTAHHRVLFRAAVAIVCLAPAAPALAQQAVFLVRHAEKLDESEDPPLSASGTARAHALARHLASAGVKAIFVTQYRRTGLTAQPLASKLGLNPIEVRSDSSQELVDRIRRQHANDVVVVVGHSNSVPQLIKLLGHPDPIEIGHDEYDSLFVVVPRSAGPPAVLRIRY